MKQDTYSYNQINEMIKKDGSLKSIPRTINRIATEKSTMMTITDFDSMPAKQYLVKRLEISPGNLVLLCATGCSGKTMFSQYLATCISGGKPLFGTYEVQQGSIVHFDAEQSELQTVKRYNRIANGLGLKELQIVRETLKYRFDSPELKLSEVEYELTQLCEGKSLCIIDSLKAVSQADENSPAIELVLKMFKRVAEKTNCAVLCVHHKGKGKDSKQSGRGHSSIYDSADVQIDLDVSNEVYELSCAKNREAKYFDGIKYQIIDTGEFHYGQNCTKELKFSILQDDVKSSKRTQHDKILEVLYDGEIKFNDLFNQVRGDRSKFNSVLASMVEAKKINKTKGKYNADMYSLVNEGGK